MAYVLTCFRHRGVTLWSHHVISAAAVSATNSVPIATNQLKACSTSPDPGNVESRYIRLGSIERRLMYLARLYPSMEAVPHEVTLIFRRKQRDQLRVRIMLFLIVTTFFGTFVMHWIVRWFAERSTGSKH